MSERSAGERSARGRFGLSCAMSLPVEGKGRIDLRRLVEHARWCLAEGCDSLTVFGTTGEGVSLGLAERERVLGALMAAGIEPRRHIVGGVAASSAEDAVRQARALLDVDCRGVLLAPPFYFKGVTDDGLYAWFADVFETLGPLARDVILYNIPSMTAVALSVELVGRLKRAFPGIVTGVKDSSGDWANTQALLAAHADLAILVGDERQLAQAVRKGAQGSICGMANLVPRALRPLVEEGQDDARVAALVDEVLQYPVIPAVKALVAHRKGDAAWLAVRPPLASLSAAEAAALGRAYDTIFAAKAA
jgi:4-hydroxy-tetrahydrodipicolinate synthase